MAYTDIETIRHVLDDAFATYPPNIDSLTEYAQTEIDSKLVGRFPVPFDDTSKYPGGVPVLIKWIASYLAGYKLWDQRTVLEGSVSDTAAARWKAMADLMIDELRSGDRDLVDASGVIIDPSGSPSAPRFYPSGVRDKAPSQDNVPYFTRAQAGEW